jgi:hypothetical protein
VHDSLYFSKYCCVQQGIEHKKDGQTSYSNEFQFFSLLR